MAQSQSSRLQCRHCWALITLLSLSHLIFYVSVAQTLRCINGFKYQRRCHKLTLGLATEKLREMKLRINNGEFVDGFGEEDEFEINYQEPSENYFAKFKRNWALYFGFLILIYAFMVSSSVGFNLVMIAIGYVVEMALQQAFIFPLILEMGGSKGGAWIENPGKEKSYRPPKEGASQAFPALLHLPGNHLHGSVSVQSYAVSPLLGSHHSAFAVASHILCPAQTLRCINGFKYQRRCHKLTLGLATEKLREMKLRINNGEFVDGFGEEDEFEIHYQEPPENYFAKFKRNWALYFGFLILIYAFMVSSSVVLLCF
ncbi:hypothetical protein GOBAR_DD16991 [Gossypium barbadense]|nr:hypothetical protein GOBAR_DD16991 [Gossypium barbadense]